MKDAQRQRHEMRMEWSVSGRDGVRAQAKGPYLAK